MPSAHARLSSSSAHRWLNCPGSIQLTEGMPNKSSAYAEEGTVAHALAELKLHDYLDPLSLDPDEDAAEFKKIKSSEHYCGEMEEATDFYRDIVAGKLLEAGPEAELMVEQPFKLDLWVPEGFGTADAVIISGHVIEVCDLKYGKGVRVDAVKNPQLMLYGLGAAHLFGELYDFDTVRMTIIQPRLDHVSTYEMSLDDLLEWANFYVAPIAKAAYNGCEDFEAGEWCRFCPAKAVCRTRADVNLELAKLEFKKPNLLSDEEIGGVLAKGEELEKWVKDVGDYALAQAVDEGKHFNGYKLVEGRSVRKYADDLKVAEALKAAGFDEALLYERKLYGITAMEKIVGKKRFTEILGDLIVKPAGKLTLVPESDKRVAVGTADAARDDFK